MSTGTLKVGPTLDDLKAFYRAADDAMDAINVLREMVLTEDAASVWDSLNALINVIQVDQTDGHPAYAAYVEQAA